MESEWFRKGKFALVATVSAIGFFYMGFVCGTNDNDNNRTQELEGTVINSLGCSVKKDYSARYLGLREHKEWLEYQFSVMVFEGDNYNSGKSVTVNYIREQQGFDYGGYSSGLSCVDVPEVRVGDEVRISGIPGEINTFNVYHDLGHRVTIAYRSKKE